MGKGNMSYVINLEHKEEEKNTLNPFIPLNAELTSRQLFVLHARELRNLLRDLENMVPSEISPSEKDKYHEISLICGV